MAKLPKPIDRAASEALRLAPADSDEAARALLIAADYIRQGKPLPSPLDKYIAEAIEYSMHKAKEHRNTSFLRELHLEAQNRRPSKAHWVDAGHKVATLIEGEGLSQNAAAAITAAEYDISSSSAKRLYKQWLVAVKENERINREIDAEERDPEHKR